MDYLEITQDFIEKTKFAQNMVELSTIFEKVIKQFGCTYFICASSVDPINPPAHAIVLTNYPAEWVRYFSEQQYQHIDPIYISSLHNIIPFTWSDNRWRSTLDFDQTKILNEASEIELGEGFTVPIHSSDGYPASCSVVFKAGEVDPLAFNAIHLMSFYLYNAALKMKIDRLGMSRKMLTSRQRQCLELIAQGKSDWTIGKLLGVSESTVKYHVQKTLRKLKVATRTQALVHGLFLGEIKYLDIRVSPPDQSGPTNIHH